MSASMADGLLSINVEKVIPEEQQPIEIEIS
jgi:HSP20 family molecular chaperone IbpA